jgi:glutaredoxin/glutathione-dependent peroxiredoxin
MSIKIGDRIPSVTLSYKDANGVQTIATDDLFKAKKVVLVAVSGAFTPSCSNQHLPGFIRSADEIKEKGVDTIAFVSINDAFVMSAWGKDRQVDDKILMLADSNGAFTKAIGQECDLGRLGLGVRSQRYAMIVEDGVVKSLEVDEPVEVAQVSNASRVLEKL